MAEKILITCDVETDFGGRTNGTDGLDKGIPLILKTLEEFKKKCLFFINTEIMDSRPGVIQDIINAGHEIGCHGHFHTCFKESWRAYQNMMICQEFLKGYSNQSRFEWRAPKFHQSFYGHEYSFRDNHVGLLKSIWLKTPYKSNSILYFHPFDIVETSSRPPNLFCKLWYSKPKKAYETFRRILSQLS